MYGDGTNPNKEVARDYAVKQACERGGAAAAPAGEDREDVVRSRVRGGEKKVRSVRSALLARHLRKTKAAERKYGQQQRCVSLPITRPANLHRTPLCSPPRDRPRPRHTLTHLLALTRKFETSPRGNKQ